MNKEYQFHTDKIEVRTTMDSSGPRYVVKGYAVVPNKLDTYKFEQQPDGSYKTFKSMFTDNCIKSIKKQAAHKRLFVDSQHELAVNANVEGMLKGKINDVDLKEVKNLLKVKQLPLAKLTNIDIDEKGLFIETELNPSFREYDDQHKHYFDAIWKSLENKYLNGISITFADSKSIINEEGNLAIDDVNVLGFSYMDHPSLPENNIVDVAMRTMIESTRKGENMSEENENVKKELEDAKAQAEAAKKEAEDLKAQIAEKEKVEAEAKKQADIEAQKAEQKSTEEKLQAEIEALKTKQAELEKKSVVNAEPDKYGKPPAENNDKKYDNQFYKDQIADITKDKSSQNPTAGFGELVNLHVEPTTGLDKSNRDYVREHRLLEKDKADIQVRPPKQ